MSKQFITDDDLHAFYGKILPYLGENANYTNLANKPSIESVELSGNKTASDLGLAKATDIPSVSVTQTVSSGTKIATITVDNTTTDLYAPQGGGGTSDYTDLSNKPSIESVTLSGNKTAGDLGLVKNSDLATVYSTTEKIVGTWISGEPVYQKVIALDTVTLGTTYSINIESLNMDRLLDAWGSGTLYHNENSQGRVIFPSKGVGTYSQAVYIKGNVAGTGLVIYSEKSGASSTQTIQNGYLVIQYTKAS